MLKSKCVLVYGLSEEEIEKLKKINFKVINISEKIAKTSRIQTNGSLQ